MSKSKYDNLKPTIEKYFAKKGINIVIEPHGSRGADIEDANGTILIGEIKDTKELSRDLKGYWSQWNSNQSFGGKTKDYKLSHSLPPSADNLNSEEKGWLAVICGQVNHYRQTKNLQNGWLVYEDCRSYEPPVKKALKFLKTENLISNYSFEEFRNLGFVCVSFY